ncbi:MAG: penicillin acylase family protein [Alphaproteobacteria bacterium HGW-Alphaproteobacteria-12]|nr:MAG: penicillin acylase family protein [Alphaproteobacteria bacterium HGW-Alphaproteobacteria-12]
MCALSRSVLTKEGGASRGRRNDDLIFTGECLFERMRLLSEPGLDIRRDTFGVPHVTGANLDSVYRGMGYCHGTDRGLQMALMRILGRGQGSAFLDSSDEMLATDRFFRRMNWGGETACEIAKLDAHTRRLLDAYCDGVNLALSRRVPWELRLLGHKPAPWCAEDCILISRMAGYLTLSQSQGEIERLLVELVQAGVGRAHLDEIFPGLLEGLDIDLIKRVELGERIVPLALWGSAAPRMMASNNWVVAGARTARGAPILANDPHLEINRLPNVWCELVLRGPDRWAIGATMPGLPGILVGRTRELAWGATYTFMDTVDSWVEHCRDGMFRVEGERWEKFRLRNETITRKGKAPVTVTFHENDHGVLDGEPSGERYLLATRWSCARSGAASLMAIAGMWRARSVEEGMALLGRLETPWNYVFADRKGDIGYQMTGLMPRRREGASGFVPLPGWEPSNDWQGFVPPEDLPRCVNPECGYIATANQDLNHLGVAKPINAPMGDYRARRIEALLERGTAHTEADMFAIQHDVYSLQGERFMEVLRPLLPDTPQGQILRDWDCCYDLDSQGAHLFERVYRALLLAVFGAGGFGAPAAAFLAADSGIFVDFYANFDRILLSGQSVWFGGTARDDLYRPVIAAALAAPAQAWGVSQRVTLGHILFGGRLPRLFGFDRGPVAIKGGRATPHQGQIYRSGGRATSFAPSLRIVADLGSDDLLTSMSGGPSDRRFSRFYCSDLPRWIAGRYKRLAATL